MPVTGRCYAAGKYHSHLLLPLIVLYVKILRDQPVECLWYDKFNISSYSTSLNIEVRYKSIIGRTKKLSFPSTCLSAWINALETCTLPWSLIRYHIECSLYLMLAINYLMTDQNWGEKIHHALLPGWIARRVRKKVSLISGLSSSGTTTTTTCFGSRDRQHLVSNMERCDCHLNFLSQIEPVRQPQTMCLTIWDFKVCDHHQNRLAHT